jgi:FixJ family two-component response regulator
MLSGQAEQAAVDRAKREAGLHEFLAKPWNAAELVEAINQGLRERL